MKELEIEGKSIEQAIEEGLIKLGASRDQVEIKILEEGKTGFLGLGGVSAKVKLILNDSLEANYSHLLDLAKTKLEKILNLMNLNVKVNATFFGGRILLDIKGEDSAIIIGKSGQTLDAVENIVNLIVSKIERSSAKIRVDAEKYRLRREERIKSLAHKLAKEATETGRPIEMEPMSPYERRWVHVALENDKNVTTASKGDRRDKIIVIMPTNRKDSFN